MNPLSWLFGNALAGFMDFCVGALIVSILAVFTQTPLSWWYLAIGGALALLPDADIILPVLTFDPTGGSHRETVFHRPLFLLPVATLLAWWAAGGFWAIATFACVVWHFLHDIDGGIAWLWPLYRARIYPGAPAKPLTHAEFVERTWLTASPVAVRELSIGAFALAAALFLFLISR